jgi:hypothetical protein
MPLRLSMYPRQARAALAFWALTQVCGVAKSAAGQHLLAVAVVAEGADLAGAAAAQAAHILVGVAEPRVQVAVLQGRHAALLPAAAAAAASVAAGHAAVGGRRGAAAAAHAGGRAAPLAPVAVKHSARWITDTSWAKQGAVCCTSMVHCCYMRGNLHPDLAASTLHKRAQAVLFGNPTKVV